MRLRVSSPWHGLMLAPAAAERPGRCGVGQRRQFQAAAGVANDVLVTATPGSVTFTDAADVISEAVTACEGTGPTP